MGGVLEQFKVFPRASDYFEQFGEKKNFSGGVMGKASLYMVEGHIQIGVIRSKPLAGNNRD